jgi:hypothetical protein
MARRQSGHGTFGLHSDDSVRRAPDASQIAIGVSIPWEKVVTPGGYAYTDWRDPMPRLPDGMANTVVYLYHDRLSAEDGVDKGGSGFLISEPSSEPASRHHYAVTNAHVIEEDFPVVRVNLRHPSSGYKRSDCFEFCRDSWICHPKHDLAVHSFSPDISRSIFDAFAVSFMDPSYFLTEQQCAERQIGVGDELVYIGRFAGHAGKVPESTISSFRKYIYDACRG